MIFPFPIATAGRRGPLVLAMLAAAMVVQPLVPGSRAQEMDAPDPAAAARELKEGNPESEAWARALRVYGQPDGRAAVLDAIKARPEFPKSALVARLRHPELGVRMAALEILEGAAGEDFGFNPWVVDEEDPATRRAMEAWSAWAGGKDAAALPGTSAPDEESMGIYLRDIMGGQRERAERALRMLEPHGEEATGRIQRFLLDTPNLSEVAQARLRAAQYRIVLRPAAGSEAASVAQRLAFGTLDQQISALGQLRQFGLASMPIAMHFLGSDDPLVRESALDTLLLMGGGGIFPVLQPMLEKETEPNVIHAAIRRFADIKVAGTQELLAKWLLMEDENLVVECLETLAKRTERSYSSSSSGGGGGGLLGAIFGGGRSSGKATDNPLHKAVLARFGDPSWRIRAAAFAAAGKLRIGGIGDAVLKGMDDPDEFVQLAAMDAAAALELEAAIPKMESLFLAHPERMPVIASGMATMERPLTGKMLDAMTKAPPEHVIGVVAALRTKGSVKGDAFLRLAGHPDPDVRAAALGALAKGYGDPPDDGIRDRLVHELTEGEAMHARSVVENLSLPQTESGAASALGARLDAAANGPTTLDPLFAAFLEPLGQGDNAAAAPVPRAAPGSLEARLFAIASGGRADLDEDTRFRAAIVLLKSGSPAAAAFLHDGMASRPVSQRTAIADGLSNVPESIALPMLRELLVDPAERVRKEAVGAALYGEDRIKTTTMVLDLLADENGALQPWDVYGYSLESAVSSGVSRGQAMQWAKNILERGGQVPARVLALTMAPRTGLPLAAIEPALADPSPMVRRAAAYAWLDISKDRPARLEALAADPSPLVREAVPSALCPLRLRSWQIRFNDLRVARESTTYEYTRTRQKATVLRPAEEARLREMMAHDAAVTVRFEAAYTLLANSKPIDIPGFLRLISEQPDQQSTRERIARFLSEEYQRLGKPFARLLLYADTRGIDPELMSRMQQHFGLDAAALASFAARGVAPEAGPAPVFLDVPEAAPSGEEHPVTLVYFFSPGCAECEKVARMIERLEAGPVKLKVVKENIKTSEGGLLNQALCLRLGLPAVQQGVSPSVFTPVGALVSTAITPEALDALVGRAAATPAPEDWAMLSNDERATADAALEEKFQQLTFLYVAGGGLLDGINPCAFATIIFFLSYLQVARRTPRQILWVGLAFITAIFITYFLAGLVLFQFLAWIDQLAWARKTLNLFFAGFALLVALFSFRDAWLARRGRLQDMTLQLPGFLKDRIRGTIRGGAKQSRYVLAAFTTGIVISLLELACTGQVYAPIIYAVQKGSDHAVGWLLVYNLAFITPLVIIFALAFTGMKSQALIHFQQKHTALVKLLLGLLFLGLFFLLAFGSHLLPGGRG